MNAIVATDAKWGIGKDNDLLFRIKEDMIFFKNMTMGKVVIMGRKTYESIGKALDGRINIVITNNPERYENNDDAIFCSLSECNEIIKYYDTDDIFIIGGSSIYENFIDRCTYVYHTYSYGACNEANKFMPNLAINNFVLDYVITTGPGYSINRWIKDDNSPYNGVVEVCTKDYVQYGYTRDLKSYKDIFSGNNMTTTMISELIYNNEYIDINCIIPRKINDSTYVSSLKSSNKDYEVTLYTIGESESDSLANLFNNIHNFKID